MRKAPRFSAIRGFFRLVNAGVVLGCFCGAGFVAGALMQLGKLLPDTSELSSYRPRLTTEIYSTEVQRDGSETHTLLARVFQEDRQPVDLKIIPPDLIHGTIAIEDRRFYTHRGISPRDMARAAWVDFRHQGARQGASTITQQLVRNVWLTQEKTWDRKIKEAMLALEVERKYSKDEILEMYLNEVCYGHGAFGVRTAARLYYNKPVDKLELHEAAMLAGLPQWPVGYSPYRSPDRCKQRRDQVLGWMAREGYITAKQAREAARIPVERGIVPLREVGVVANAAPHFTHLVIRELCDEYGSETVYQGGLRVFTSLDVRAQKIAEEELTRGVESLRREGEIKGGLVGQGALACIEAKTGYVLAMSGGVGPYDQVQYNRAAPGPPRFGRQPGSSFKPYVWACALDGGYGPDSGFSADPISIPLGFGKYWTPKNYSARQGGTYSLRRALADSVNLVSVRLVQKLTREKVQRFAARMLDVPAERIRPVWSMALGASEVSPLEQASGYCAFANGGLRPTRRFIRRIEDYEGQVLIAYQPELVRVLRPPVATSMLSMLRGVVTSGTGTNAAACDRPCGGKTGTTNSGRDVWWVGFTPDLSAAVWVGNDNNDPMPNGSGGRFAAPIWARFMRRVSEALNCSGEFPNGDGVTPERESEPATREGRFITVCVETGLVATPGCPATREVFLGEGKSAPGSCTLHSGRLPAAPHEVTPTGGVTVRVCPSSGMLATSNCPATRLRHFAAGDVPTGYCTVHGGGHEPPSSGGGSGSGSSTSGGGSTAATDKPPPAGESTDKPSFEADEPTSDE